MANYSNSNQINVPEAREAMRNMKHEVANELRATTATSPPRTPATSAATWSRR